MGNNDRASSLFCLVIGLAFITGGLKMGLGPLNAPAAGFFPAVIGGIFAALSLALLITASLRKGRLQEKVSFWKEKKSWVKVSLSLLSLLFYLVFLDYLGYILTTLIFIFFLLKFVGRKGWGASVLIALFLALGSYALFKMALGVSLPRGWIKL